MADDHFALRGGNQSAVVALEKLVAGHLLQLVQRPRQRRLRDAEHFGHHPELAVFAERHQHPHMPQLESVQSHKTLLI
jgi:hypothetical protein